MWVPKKNKKKDNFIEDSKENLKPLFIKKYQKNSYYLIFSYEN